MAHSRSAPVRVRGISSGTRPLVRVMRVRIIRVRVIWVRLGLLGLGLLGLGL